VAGKLTEGTSSLLRVIQEQIEPNLIQHNQNKGSRPAGWKRPFVETASGQRRPIPATTKSVVEFPDKDESKDFLTSFCPRFSDHLKGMGRIIISFVGPPPNDFLTRKALDMLGLYLTSSTVAPLNKEYIEIDSPLWYNTTFCFQKDHLTYPSTVLPSVFTKRSTQRTSTWELAFFLS
jgi:hypothetical protein